MFTVTDEHIVDGKHICAAVDISSSCHLERLVYALVDTLSSSDVLTLVTFGTHTTKRVFRGDDPALKPKVQEMMSRSEQGSNAHVGLTALEGDLRLLFTDGLFNEGPDTLDLFDNVSSFGTPVHCIAPSHSDVLEQIACLSGGQYEVLPMTSEVADMRETLNGMMGKLPPVHYNLKLTGPFRDYKMHAVARGGQISVVMRTVRDGVARLTYLDNDGTEHEELCPFANANVFNEAASLFSPMYTFRPILKECQMFE
tara:strand:+ start:4005 stop:4769 length:765 start_codon:yes stop_codon:yes gene_type:complete